ncbi:Uncharacterised protein [Mycobacteroides abscessus subsp. abscessus]|nr:Uncharacterised protein [Mycobacteroides abscessus subsp. abscessus]
MSDWNGMTIDATSTVKKNLLNLDGLLTRWYAAMAEKKTMNSVLRVVTMNEFLKVTPKFIMLITSAKWAKFQFSGRAKGLVRISPLVLNELMMSSTKGKIKLTKAMIASR